MRFVEAGSLSALADRIGAALGAAGWQLATAESCTGGWIAKTVTDAVGSSAWFDRGFVTYSNAAKSEMLGVDPAVIDAHGAVSEACVRAMAEGALRRSRAQITVAVSGIAGPGGGTPAKPVGTVCLAWAVDGRTDAVTLHFEGDRDAVRRQTVVAALEGVLERVERQG